MTFSAIILGALLASGGADGIKLELSSETTRIDPAKSVFLSVTMKSPRGVVASLPDLRERTVGFSLAEDFAEEPVIEKDGSITQVASWRLVPEPAAEVYKIRPFAVGNAIVGPVYFENPPPPESVAGDFEIVAKKDLPPLSWKLIGKVALFVLLASSCLFGLYRLLAYLLRRVREHRMSPIERAWAELERLLKKGLPGRGRYKDFYVELTLVVRRYVQRKYAISAPHMTTEEFLSNLSNVSNLSNLPNLSDFLASSDLIKFAGVKATPETADAAVDSARAFLKGDSAK